MSAGIVIKVPMRLKATGFLTLGPRPGTPEYAEEQAARAAGLPYDYSKGRKLLIQDEEDEPPTLPSISALQLDTPGELDAGPPDEGYQG